MNNETIRTQGDGIDHTINESGEAACKTPQKNFQGNQSVDSIEKLGKEYLLKHTTSSILFDPSKQAVAPANFPTATLPKGKKFFLIPKLVNTPEPRSGLKNRRLNLVLMEPYRACVNPILPYKKNENRVPSPSSRNNLDLNDLVKHMSVSVNKAMSSEELTSPLATLKKERDFFESQLKFQIQVNAELKGLLVHSIGEDLQAKVNNLTEDKMSYAKSLSTNTEQIEQLASQSEVWRSKFLASSLMVEELAKVKTVLAQRKLLLVQSNQQLLRTLDQLRFDLIQIYQNLTFVSGITSGNLKSLNVTNLTAECLNITQSMSLNSGKIGLPHNSNFDHLDTLTESEKLAINALKESHELNSDTEEAFQAVCSKAQMEYQRERTRSANELKIAD